MLVLLVCLQFCAATVIGFVNAPVSVVESAGPAILQVALISGSLEREVFVDFVTQDGTAVGKSEINVHLTICLSMTGSFSFNNY